MATLKDIRLRIVSVRNTQQITKAMKMVSASKLRKAQQESEAALPYSQKMRELAAAVAGNTSDTADIPIFQKREGGKAVFLLITSDKGLCGGLNANLCKKVLKFLEEHNSRFDSVEFVVMGRKGNDFLRSNTLPVQSRYTDLKDKEQKVAIGTAAATLIRAYEEGKINAVFLASNAFISVINQEPHISQLLPLIAQKDEKAPQEGWQSPADSPQEISFEPDSVEFMQGIIKSFLKNQCYTALLSNVASEHGARMTAMDAATKNASEMITKLQLQYNRARQAAITTELTEIISGAESVS